MRPYEVLRAELRKKGYTAADMAKWLNMSQPSVSARMTRRTSWAIDEIYIVMDKLELDYINIYKIFPPKGVCVGDPNDQKNDPIDSMLLAVLRDRVKQFRQKRTAL